MTNVSQTVTVERLAQSGEGVVRLEGQTFGVPGTLPGEVLRVQRAGAAHDEGGGDRDVAPLGRRHVCA